MNRALIEQWERIVRDANPDDFNMTMWTSCAIGEGAKYIDELKPIIINIEGMRSSAGGPPAPVIRLIAKVFGITQKAARNICLPENYDVEDCDGYDADQGDFNEEEITSYSVADRIAGLLMREKKGIGR